MRPMKRGIDSYGEVKVSTGVATADSVQLIHSCSVRRQAVGCDRLGVDRLIVQEALQKSERSLCVPPALDHKVQDFAFIIDRPPKVRPLAADPADHLVQVPARRRGPSPLLQPLGDQGAKLDGPAPDGLVADLVGKVEKNIPEDDPRNAATIADNVGDNVGDCAGMAADLFESYAVTLVAALILGKAGFGDMGLVYPLIVPAIGILTAILGIFLTRLRSTDKSAMSAINRSFYMSAVISAALVGLATYTYLPSTFSALSGLDPAFKAEITVNPRTLAFGAVVIGILLAAAIQMLTGFFTEVGKRPVNDVAASSKSKM